MQLALCCTSSTACQNRCSGKPETQNLHRRSYDPREGAALCLVLLYCVPTHFAFSGLLRLVWRACGLPCDAATNCTSPVSTSAPANVLGAAADLPGVATVNMRAPVAAAHHRCTCCSIALPRACSAGGEPMRAMAAVLAAKRARATIQPSPCPSHGRQAQTQYWHWGLARKPLPST